MSAHRDAMMTALKEQFVPMLRQKGFVGSFPHFRRKLDTRIDFLDVQFARERGRFCINLGQTGPKGFRIPRGPTFRSRRQPPAICTTARASTGDSSSSNGSISGREATTRPRR